MAKEYKITSLRLADLVSNEEDPQLQAAIAALQTP